MSDQGFGPHVTIDITSSSEKLNDLSFIFNLLNNLPDKIGMTKITQAYVFPYSGQVPDDYGITGMVIIAESHISIHTFPHKNYMFFDIFSCKPFDYGQVVEIIKEEFNATNSEVQVVMRGKDFPRG